MAKDTVEAAKKTRTIRPVYAIMSVKDADGNAVMGLTKENLTVHSTHKDAEDVLGMLENGTLPPGSFYKRIPLA